MIIHLLKADLKNMLFVYESGADESFLVGIYPLIERGWIQVVHIIIWYLKVIIGLLSKAEEVCFWEEEHSKS